jgi:hypothetical protein
MGELALYLAIFALPSMRRRLRVPRDTFLSVADQPVIGHGFGQRLSRLRHGSDSIADLLSVCLRTPFRERNFRITGTACETAGTLNRRTISKPRLFGVVDGIKLS